MNSDSLKFELGRGGPALRLPIALGHFLPWYTVRGKDFPLSAAKAATIPNMPVIEDYRHWRNGPGTYRRANLNMPEIGYYDSRDPKVIRWQIEAARAAGLEGFIINWNGTNSVENVITLIVLDEIERWNRDHPSEQIAYIYSIDSQAQIASEGRKPVTLAEDVQYIHRELIRPSYIHRQGRPVFSCFPYQENLPEWLKAFDGVYGNGNYDFLWMYRGQGKGETGCFVWVRPDESAVDHSAPYSWFDADNTGSAFADDLYKQWGEKQLGHLYGMGGVWPAFNDTLVAWAWKSPDIHSRVRPRIIARETESGNTYEQLWETYLNSIRDEKRLPLPLVQVVTWNDWAESSTVEPSRDYGRRFIEINRTYVVAARAAWQKRFGA